MKSERLTNDMRESIVNSMMTHRFSKEVEALWKARAAFARLVYNDIFPKKQREQMEALPAGWLPEYRSFYINVQGCSVDVYFSGRTLNGKLDSYHPDREKATEGASVRFPYEKSGAYKSIKGYAADSPIAHKFTDIERQTSELDEAIRSALTAANKAVNSVTTTGRLVDIWPEVKSFLPKGKAAVQLPALPVETLNTIFKLPVRESRT